VYPLKIDLPEDFLNEEIRNNIKVSPYRKEIYAIELEWTPKVEEKQKFQLKVFAELERC
jgi:hypothetical protein